MNPEDTTNSVLDDLQVDNSERKEKANSNVLIAIGVVVFLLASIVGYVLFSPSADVTTSPEPILSPEEQESQAAIRDGLLGESPEELHALFLDDVQSGTKDKFTKTHAYFVTHRFYDNGGNIYEIFDYVNKHPELSFLKEAETIFPEYFDLIKSKQLPTTYTDRANLANMAYAEILEKNGYADAALLSTLANQYSKTALFLKLYAAQDLDRQSFFNSLADTLLVKSENYIKKARPVVVGIYDGSTPKDSYTSHDAMVGLNQYASALRYLTAHGVQVDSIDHTGESAQIFEYTAALAKREVTDLVNFTSLIDASTLVIAGSRDVDKVQAALAPIISFDTSLTPPLPNGAIDRIIKAKNEPIAPELINRKLDVYSRTNLSGLANIAPQFRDWLITNGWSETQIDEVEIFVFGL